MEVKNNGKSKGFSARYALPMLALLILASSAFAQSEFTMFREEQGFSFQQRMGQDWLPIASLAVFICILFNTLLYMLGYLMQSEAIKRYAKSEFMQVTASSLMIFLSVALLYTLTDDITNSGVQISAIGFMGEILGTGQSFIACAASDQMPGKFSIWSESRFGSGPLGAFKCKVQEKITALDKAYDKVYKGNLPTERLSSLCLTILGAPVYCWDWNMEVHTKVEQAHLMGTKIVSLLVPLHGQYSFAEYLQRNMLTIFLPAGLALRIFPLTRGVGGLFIAIAVGFFFIFPMFVLLTDPTFVKVEGDPPADKQAGMCFTGFKGSTVLLAGLDYGDALAKTELATSDAAELVFQVTIATLFYPFIAFVLTMIFIRATTPLLGGDTGEIMRMVSRLG